MTKYKNILVVADEDQDHQPALSRAVHLASKLPDVKITLFLAAYDFFYDVASMLSSDERQMMQHSIVNQREEQLKEVISSYRDKGPEIELQVLWHKHAYEAIIAEVINGHYDLLIKARHRNDTVIFTPTDWHILRKCPCSVLMVKEHEWPENGKVLASVNLIADNETHVALNDKIVEEAKAMAEMLSAEVNLVNAYPTTPPYIAAEIAMTNLPAYNETVRNNFVEAMNRLRSRYGIDEEQSHVLEGLPEEVIPTVAQQIDAELVILGTTSRTSHTVVLIGSTAEHIIDNLNCDLLALKPDGYISPLAPHVE